MPLSLWNLQCLRGGNRGKTETKLIHNYKLWQWRKRQCVMKRNNRKDFDEWSDNGFLEVMILGWNLKYENGNSLANMARKTAPGTEKYARAMALKQDGVWHFQRIWRRKVWITHTAQKKTSCLRLINYSGPQEIIHMS